jgi:hypothetical protein
MQVENPIGGGLQIEVEYRLRMSIPLQVSIFLLRVVHGKA